MVVEIISEYLTTNKRLVVPNLGAFIVKKVGEQILFSNLIKSDDGVLRELLVNTGLSEIEAAGVLDRFVFEVNFRLQNSGECALKNFGYLRVGANGTIAFEYKPGIEGESLDKEVVVEQDTPAQPETQEDVTVQEDVESLPQQVDESNPVKRENKVVELGKSRYDDKEEVRKSTSIRRDKSIKGLTYHGGGATRRSSGYSSSRRSNGVGGWLLVLVVAAAMLAIGVLLYDEIFGDKSGDAEPQTTTPQIKAEPGVENPDLEYIEQTSELQE